MRQVLFEIPLPSWAPLDHIPIYGFGMMLFITFVVCTWVAGRRAANEGISPLHLQDLTIWMFVCGIVGARIVYMIQYGVPIAQFFRIWEGGLVFYGSAVGGMIGYGLGYWFVIRKHGLSAWQLADILAPSVALGLCIGRIGCLLNGCCYGHVACPHCYGIHFPLSAPPRYSLVKEGYQTAAGFALADRKQLEEWQRNKEVEQVAGLFAVTPLAPIHEMPAVERKPFDLDDPRSIVSLVEPGSRAAQSGLRKGDIVLEYDGHPNNQRILAVWEKPDALENLATRIGPPDQEYPAEENKPERTWQYKSTDLELFKSRVEEVRKLRLPFHVYDGLWNYLTIGWPRGKTDLQLTVQHADGTQATLPPFEPRTLGLHPTQVYESISMILLFLLLTAYYPFRRHYGEVFALLLICYPIHRFINEQLRNDTDTYGLFSAHLTLSQWGSILILLAGLVLAIWLWRKPLDDRLRQETPEPMEAVGSAQV